MTETPDRTESIFAAIAALPSVEARAAYLGESCATDPILRQRVEFLLRAHDRARLLLDWPITGGTEQTVAGVPHRYRAAWTTAAAIGLLLLTGGAFSIWQAARVTRAEMAARTAEEEAQGSRAEAKRQRARAEASEKLAGEQLAQVAAEKTRVEEEKQVAQSVRDFLQNKLLGQADLRTQANALLRAGGFPAEAKQNPTIRDLLDRAAHELSPEKIDANFPNQPLVQAEILRTVGNTYRSVGEYGKAISYLQRSAALVRQKAAIRHPDTLATIGGQEMADLYLNSGKSDQSLPLGKGTSKLMKVTRGPDDPDTLAIIEDLGNAYRAYGEPNLAIPLLEETLKIKKETLGANHPDTLTSMYNLAAAYQAAGMLDLALPLCEETMMLMRQRCFSPELPALRNCMRNLALLYRATGKPDLVVPLCEETLNRTRARLGPNHPDTLADMGELAAAYQAVGKLDLAVTLFKETLKGAILYFGPDHPYTLQIMSNLALAYQAAGKLELAIPLFEDTLKRYLASCSPQPRTLISKSKLASAYQSAGKLDLALPLFEEAYRGGKKYSELRSAGTFLLAAYVQAGKTGQAVTLTEELLADAHCAVAEGKPTTGWTFGADCLIVAPGQSLCGGRTCTSRVPGHPREDAI